MKNKLTARELSNFCGQMGMLLHSGISTAEGLHILCDESKTDADRQILTPLIRSVEENGSLSRALDESGIFPTSMTAYVRTGEETGCLDEIMESLSSHYEQEEEISGQIRSAVTYPLLMLGMMAVVILVLLIKVLPVFQQVFNQMGMEMNGVSRGLLNAGNVISRYSSVFLILAAALIGCILFFSLTEKGHSLLRKMVIHLPAAPHHIADVVLVAVAGTAGQGVFFKNVYPLPLHLAIPHQIAGCRQGRQAAADDISRFAIHAFGLAGPRKGFVIATGIIHRRDLHFVLYRQHVRPRFV